MTSKCKSTTSATFGFRLCGMKVYNAETQTFSSRDKYYGRRVKPRELPDALSLFFHDGVRLRTELIAVFLKRLYELLDIFQTDETAQYRFWSSSLLLIYEGDQAPASLTREGYPRIDLKIIDFAHSVHNQECNDDQSGVDRGMVRGLISLIECLGNISLETCNSPKSLKTPGWRQGSCTGTPQSTQGSTSRTRPMPSRALGSLVSSHSQNDFNDLSTLIGPMGTSFGTLSGSNESLSLAGSPFASFGAPFGTSMLQNDVVSQAANQAATDIMGFSSLASTPELGVTVGSINGCRGEEELESFSISDVT